MRALPFLLAALLSACGTVQITERNFIRPDKEGAPKETHIDAAGLVPGTTMREESLSTPDGASLRGVTLDRPGSERAVLYFGGNAFHLDRHGQKVLPLLGACGTDVVVFDYRGYGRSEGAPTVATMKADALRIFDHVNASHPGGVIVHGQSLGSFMAAYIAQQRPGTQAIVLESTANSVQDWADVNMPWYARLFVQIELGPSLQGVDNVAALSKYRGRSLVLAGEADKTTPVALARKVHDALPGTSKQWLVAPGAGHNDVFRHPHVAPVYCAFVNG